MAIETNKSLQIASTVSPAPRANAEDRKWANQQTTAAAERPMKKHLQIEKNTEDTNLTSALGLTH